MIRIQKLATPYYIERGLKPPALPEDMPTPIPKAPPKKGFFESIFSSSTPATKAVPFDQLPK
jgi:hypothetical protein